MRVHKKEQKFNNKNTISESCICIRPAKYTICSRVDLEIIIHFSYSDNSCTHTEVGQTGAYWGVDLGGKYTVTSVEITNREVFG